MHKFCACYLKKSFSKIEISKCSSMNGVSVKTQSEMSVVKYFDQISVVVSLLAAPCGGCNLGCGFKHVLTFC